MPTKTLIGPAWFSIAVETLVVLAHADAPCASASIAEDVDAHAAFLRRVLAQLARAQLVEAREGRDGGYRLARPADQITLAEVYNAVKAKPSDETECVATNIHRVLDEISDEAEQHMLGVFARYTLASVISRALTLDPSP